MGWEGTLSSTSKKMPYIGSENRSELCDSSSLALSTSDFPDWIPEPEALQ